jgi:glycosyltransferase EpsJ
MEEGLQLIAEEKKNLNKKYSIDKYTPFTKDLSEYTILRYAPYMFNNLRNNPNETDKIKGISRILNMPMIKDAMKYIGFRNIYPSWKEYVFYLAMKFKLAYIVYKLYFK